MPRAKSPYKPITLTEDDLMYLLRFTRTGKHHSREIVRANTLLKCHAKQSAASIATKLNIVFQTVHRTVNRYHQGGILSALFDKVRSGRPTLVTEHHEAMITAIACSKVPVGKSKWTLEMISDELVNLGFQDGSSMSTVRRALKKANSNPGSNKAGVSRS